MTETNKSFQLKFIAEARVDRRVVKIFNDNEHDSGVMMLTDSGSTDEHEFDFTTQT